VSKSIKEEKGKKKKGKTKSRNGDPRVLEPGERKEQVAVYKSIDMVQNK